MRIEKWCGVAFLACGGVAQGQCQLTWLDGGPSLNAPYVGAMGVWDRGGEPHLVVAGSTGGVGASPGIATWDGERWHDLDAQVPDASIDALLIDGSDLFIGGKFLTIAGVQGQTGFVGRLTAGGWAGMPGYLTPIRALAKYNGQIVAGGQSISFLQPMPARWTGTTWQPLGSGVNGEVRTMIEFEGNLIVGGSFTAAGGQAALRVARWDGVAWHPMGAGFAPFGVTQLVAHAGTLYALGNFNSTGGTPVAGLARWTGAQWETVGTPPGRATSMASVGGDLLVSFWDEVNSVVPMYRWTGTAWELFAQDPPGPDGTTVDATGPMVMFEGRLHVNGRGLVARDGEQWLLIGDQSRTLAGRVSSLVEHEGRVVMAGDLDAFGFTGGDPGMGIAAWNGSAIERHSPIDPPGETQLLLTQGQSLLAFGMFSWTPTLRTLAARWDGASWQPQGASVPPLVYTLGGVASVNDRLFAISRADSTSSLAGGIADITGPTLGGVGVIDLDNPRGITGHGTLVCVAADQATLGAPLVTRSNPVLSWDGQSWTVLADASTFAGAYTAISTYNSRLIVAGEFSGPAGVHISAWDGSAWSPLGGGLPSAPTSLSVINGSLYAMGLVFECGQSPECGGYAVWNGSAWSFVQFKDASRARHVTTDGQGLYMTGSFYSSLARYQGSGFARLGLASTSPCPADLTTGAIAGQLGYGDPDGNVDNSDFFYYLASFSRGDVFVADLTSTALPSDPCYGRPDGILNNDDFFFFLAAFAQGC